MEARVRHVHLCGDAGAGMVEVAEAQAIAGVGLDGDRYARSAGFWQDAKVSRDLTLIAQETLDRLEDEHGISLEPGEARRTLTTEGIELAALIGHHFWVGDVLAAATGPCPPCRHLSELTGKDLLRPLARSGGIRADIVVGGVVRRGAPSSVSRSNRASG